MRILFIGDIYGRAGREALANYLPSLKDKLKPDVVIVNGENAAHGIGITEKMCKEFYDLGVDCITSGNHIWDQREIIPYIARDEKLLRPANFPPGTPGNGAYKITLNNGDKILIINAMCRVFMDPIDDPFRVLDEIVSREKLGQTVQAIFVDLHGEASSEKMSMAHYLDGRISALVGTHTHIPTADAHILNGGTGYQTDAGMTGDFDSVIGVRKDIPIQKFVKKMPGEKMIPSGGEATLCGTFIVTDENTGLCKAIEPVRVGPRLKNTIPLL
ncbi:MAG: TIGR00282 family metallophosphoesterase [Alphaproteobacteria bacterium]|nr:TIGR00282 family metallophosphoesterase [Alphaproteobacteria bacterium]MCD8570585.1 TIGR00282 family metallophosphoesterase [Alphaproteobacteria bacterium]